MCDTVSLYFIKIANNVVYVGHNNWVSQASTTHFIFSSYQVWLLCFQGEGASVKDAAAAGIIDCYLLKVWAVKLATNAVNTVLRVDQVS